jgi:hypothetical protein
MENFWQFFFTIRLAFIGFVEGTIEVPCWLSLVERRLHLKTPSGRGVNNGYGRLNGYSEVTMGPSWPTEFNHLQATAALLLGSRARLPAQHG